MFVKMSNVAFLLRSRKLHKIDRTENLTEADLGFTLVTEGKKALTFYTS